jgi:hypothetical protein
MVNGMESDSSKRSVGAFFDAEHSGDTISKPFAAHVATPSKSTPCSCDTQRNAHTR